MKDEAVIYVMSLWGHANETTRSTLFEIACSLVPFEFSENLYAQATEDDQKYIHTVAVLANQLSL